MGGGGGGRKECYPDASPVSVTLQPGTGLVDVGHVPGPDTAANLEETQLLLCTQ